MDKPAAHIANRTIKTNEAFGLIFPELSTNNRSISTILMNQNFAFIILYLLNF